MSAPAIALPETVEELRALALAMAQRAARADALEAEVSALKTLNADADARIERLTSIPKAFERARYGRRSEKRATPKSMMSRLRLPLTRSPRVSRHVPHLAPSFIRVRSSTGSTSRLGPQEVISGDAD